MRGDIAQKLIYIDFLHESVECETWIRNSLAI